VESRGLAGLDKPATRLARDTGMIQITVQMRVLAIEPVDGRKGIRLAGAAMPGQTRRRSFFVCSFFEAAGGFYSSAHV
jgi:hypothetical protein